MLSAQEQKELFDQLRAAREDIRKLQAELNSVNEKKEDWFRKKEECSKQIHALIQSVKTSRDTRNKMTEEVKQSKEKRQGLNVEFKETLDRIKDLSKEKEDLISKHKLTEDPIRIKREISRLERNLETEVISFEKEKLMMKRINQLRKQYNQANELGDVWRQVRELSRRADTLRRSSDETHGNVQEKAKLSQGKHEEVVILSKNIDELRVKEKEAFENFLELKKEFLTRNQQLKDQLHVLKELNKKADDYKLVQREESEKKKLVTLQDKGAAVEKKIQNKTKLTTEDLLVFQSIDRHSNETKKKQ
jgi:uncharacterized coiled-coil DUF342 family protein